MLLPQIGYTKLQNAFIVLIIILSVAANVAPEIWAHKMFIMLLCYYRSIDYVLTPGGHA